MTVFHVETFVLSSLLSSSERSQVKQTHLNKLPTLSALIMGLSLEFLWKLK